MSAGPREPLEMPGNPFWTPYKASSVWSEVADSTCLSHSAGVCRGSQPGSLCTVCETGTSMSISPEHWPRPHWPCWESWGSARLILHPGCNCLAVLHDWLHGVRTHIQSLNQHHCLELCQWWLLFQAVVAFHGFLHEWDPQVPFETGT